MYVFFFSRVQTFDLLKMATLLSILFSSFASSCYKTKQNWKVVCKEKESNPTIEAPVRGVAGIQDTKKRKERVENQFIQFQTKRAEYKAKEGGRIMNRNT